MGEEEFATACHAVEQQPLLQFRQVPFLPFPDAWVLLSFCHSPPFLYLAHCLLLVAATWLVAKGRSLRLFPDQEPTVHFPPIPASHIPWARMCGSLSGRRDAAVSRHQRSCVTSLVHLCRRRHATS